MTAASVPRLDFGQRAAWRERLSPLSRASAAVLARPPSPRDATELLRDAVRYVQIASLFDDLSEPSARAIDRGASAAAAAVLLQRSFSAGEAVTVEADFGGVFDDDGAFRAMPAGETGVTWPDWLHGFALAALARDEMSLGVLTAANSAAACGEPQDAIDPFWAPLCEALAALWRGDAEATAEAAGLAAQAMDAARLLDRGRVDLTLRPLLALARAVAAGEAAAFNDALAECLRLHRRFWEQPDVPRHEEGFLALPAAGLAALAHARGLPLTVDSGYLPAATTHFVRAWAAPTLLVRFDPRAILRPDEARWFLDLAGYPRQARTHRIVDRDGSLVAHYEVAPTAHTPAASVDFVMPEPGRAPSAPLALDVGQLMWVAEVFAGGEPARAPLVEAIAAADAALARFAPGDERLTEAAFFTPLGREQWRREPGRFTRARLTAYRDALVDVLKRLDAAPAATAGAAPRPSPAPQDAELDAFGRAMASIGLIKEIVTPMLEALRGPQRDEVLAALRPQAGDCAKVFADPRAVAAMHSATEVAWAQGGVQFEPPGGEQTVLRVFVAPAGMLADDNVLSRHFPGGYRAIAHLLDPHRTWVCWKYTRPEETAGLAYDGLVWCDDHWAWFPKPYRTLAPLVADRRNV